MKIVNITIIVSAILIGLITIGFLMFKKIKNYFRNWNDTKLKRELKKELDELLYKNGNPFHVADYDALLEKLTELRCKLYSRRLEIDEDKKARKEMRRIQVFMPIIDEKIEKLENIRAQVKKAVEMDERIALEDQKKRDENSAIVNSLQEKISTLVDIFSNEISDLRSLIQDRSDVVEDQYQQANDNFDIESIDSAVISASSDSEPELN